MIKAWRNRRAALVVKFALYTGLRLDEVIGLEWKDVDTEKGFVKIVDPKGKPATLPVSSQAIAILSEAKGILPFEDCLYVFPNKHGERRVYFHKIWTRIREKAGIQKGFGSMISATPLLRILRVLARLTCSPCRSFSITQTPQMTQRYAHLLDAALRRGANVADKVFGNGNGGNGKISSAQDVSSQ